MRRVDATPNGDGGFVSFEVAPPGGNAAAFVTGVSKYRCAQWRPRDGRAATLRRVPT
jgi:hypothetical protein